MAWAGIHRVAGLGIVAAAMLGAPAGARAQPLRRLGPGVRVQIAALLKEKAQRTPDERKLASRLLFAVRRRRGQAAVPGVPSLRTHVATDAAGRVELDLRGAITQGLLDAVVALGGRVESAHPERDAARVSLPLDAVESLAARPELRSVRPADRAFTRVVSEGDVAMRADQARADFSVDGSGVKVAVLSDGVDALASRQAAGELPPTVTVLPGQAGSGNEGTAMLEIVHDLAPGADLLFATAFGSQASFAANIEALRAAGADVIVDDVGYFAEGVFQDDDVAAAVDAVTAEGALYFSAAGNAGSVAHGTAGVYEGDFVDSGDPIDVYPTHAFTPTQPFDTVTVDSPYAFTLQWSDPLGSSANDYDLLLLDPGLTQVLAASSNVQDGSGDPFESIDSTNVDDTGDVLVVLLYAGAPRMLDVNANRGELEVATGGQIFGHPGARGALAVAAVDARSAQGPGGTFAGTEPVESYSSDGPRRVHYEADGTPITPGNFSSTGGELRQKPDLAAADCVRTSTPGFSTFCGTSAAAPHAAAVAALLLQAAAGSGLGAPEVRFALAHGALDIEAPGVDSVSGVGIGDALGWLQAAADACSDGLDNDGDGLVDLADPGCDDASDFSERSLALPCDDGLDNDGDGLIDHGADPGCRDATWPTESPQCQDGLDNDGDGFIDFDGGASVLGVPDPNGADPQCSGDAWRNREAASSVPTCGLGPGVALLLGALAAARARVRRAYQPRT